MVKEVELPDHLNQIDLGFTLENKLYHLVKSDKQVTKSNLSNISMFEVDDNQMHYFGIVKGSKVIVDKTIELKPER